MTLPVAERWQRTESEATICSEMGTMGVSDVDPRLPSRAFYTREAPRWR
jgi:hypothetical protein